ncbi:MAG: MmgE/PrpD family protein [Desulfobacteraceae bacterium]|nr:MAG: MmgE/PrpD family protein [Desulfobacteraceae bacterium]
MLFWVAVRNAFDAGTMEITRKLAEFVYHTKFSDMPDDVVQKAKECFLDWQGVALAGTTDPVAAIVGNYVRSFGGRPEARVMGANMRTDAASAAFANGVIGHALDFDDYHDETVIHASAACIPAVLALAERNRLGGKDLLEAMILGIDVCIRIGLGLGDYHYQRGWHTTATAGTFGATAGVAKLLKLEVDQIANAFGICGTQASGLRQVFGTMTKPFHAGKVSHEGVMSAFLSHGGFTAPKNIVEGELGLLDVLTDAPDEAVILKDLGSRWYVMDLSIKPYPT